MDKVYKPAEVEERIYKFWEEGGYFKPNPPAGGKKPFVIVQPPPNVTGELHIGHALTATIQDIFVRYHRMKGEPTLWLPGVDHAGIATQYVVEKDLAKEGKTRFTLGREKFIEKIGQWIKQYGNRIDHQHRRLGVSVDWSRKRFTLDKDYQESVKFAFKKLYDDGLIYRGTRIVNWCPRCQTAISDLENIRKVEDGTLYFLDYGAVKIATTRPETIFADVAVAVNPVDPRYKNLIGQKAQIPLTKRLVPIIADNLADQKFGTGALKITPAHDELDFEIWQKHKEKKLPAPRIFSLDGHLITNNKFVPKAYWGLTVAQARKRVVEDLAKNKLLTKTEKIKHAIGHCQRCNTIVEPLMSEQWFVKMEAMAAEAIKAVKDGKIKIIPKRFEKIYFNWLENIKDWCISRQIWFGHKIPIEGETDVLDTWFSSSLWPFATLGWPHSAKASTLREATRSGARGKPSDFEYFYPTTILETGYDILFFWVARMIMMGLYFTKKEPFKIVLLHGMVRDVMGRKMSKTLGNVMDPLELADKYGSDALRMGLIVGAAPGNDMRLYEEKIFSYQKFANKIWNIGRFIVLNLENFGAKVPEFSQIKNRLKPEDKEIAKSLENLVKIVTNSIEKFRISDAAQGIYQFLWHEFADIYLEKTKPRLSKKNIVALSVLRHVFLESLKLLHPFMPFITEELWSKIPKEEKGPLIFSSWPKLKNTIN